ncbi:MAG: tRNA (adenosine(37)-N6)-threonylcarbamoyltransferase complex dimerization subunit type 1 TsaB [Saprospiraceae bacterium]
MAIILNIETSTDICSVCIAKDGQVLAIRETERSYSHSEVIAIFINECKAEAGIKITDLDAVAISQGPGSYTALRIAAATAKGICYSCDIPLISISTMKALANSLKDQCKDRDVILSMIDARRMEVYYSVYNNELYNITPVAPHILTKDSFLEYNNYSRILFCGDGVAKAKEILAVTNGEFLSIECSSLHMISLSEEKYGKKLFEDIAYYEPLYYKSPNITVQKKNILKRGI